MMVPCWRCDQWLVDENVLPCFCRLCLKDVDPDGLLFGKINPESARFGGPTSGGLS